MGVGARQPIVITGNRTIYGNYPSLNAAVSRNASLTRIPSVTRTVSGQPVPPPQHFQAHVHGQPRLAPPAAAPLRLPTRQVSGPHGVMHPQTARTVHHLPARPAVVTSAGGSQTARIPPQHSVPHLRFGLN